MAYSLSDIEPLFPEALPGVDPTRLELFVAVAEAKLRLRLPSLDSRIADGSLAEVLVRSAIAGIVYRYAANPRAGIVRSESEQEGPYQNSATYRAEAARISVTDADLEGLLPVDMGGLGNYGSMRLGFHSYQLPG